MKILVTGGAGFIASHVVDGYVARGHDVTVVDDLSSGRRENVNPRAELVVADLRDPRTVEQLRGRGFDLVNHHAAQIDVRVSVADPAADAELNIVAALRLFQALIDEGPRKIVFASSGGAAYGEPQYAPQDERHPVAPISPYGCAKAAIDSYLYYYRMVHGVRAVSLRYGNVYGPRQRKDGEAGVIAIFAGLLLDGQRPRINGTGEQTRDYVFVEDVMRANMAASELDLDGIFNVGTGVEVSVNTLYDELRNAIGVDLDAEHGPAKAGEQMRSVLDGTKLRTVAKLPEPVKLDEGLRRTVEWLRSAAR
ncbi:MAG: NAD-dependent epimerase/dehydratase family protein [Acidobacteria bacterium]|nr:NAD-dependent epimerase/dehydratase family protein [Acidobacteriota bacterium]MBV9478286.1 NAD-dependent epimerase/dehydratase family protein [Acidobacteriota bacterium]